MSLGPTTRILRILAPAALALAVAGIPSRGLCQQQPVLSPDEVARAVIRADSAGDWATLIRLAHPDALVRFRGLQTFQIRTLGTSAEPGDDSLPADSTPQGRWRQARARQERFLLDSVFGVPTVDSLAHTAPDTVFARWMRATRPPGADSAAAAAPRPPVARVIGAVRSSDTLAYVVVERAVEQPLGQMPEMFRDFPRETQQADVMVMRRHGAEWRSMLDGVGDAFGFSLDLDHTE